MIAELLILAATFGPPPSPPSWPETDEQAAAFCLVEECSDGLEPGDPDAPELIDDLAGDAPYDIENCVDVAEDGDLVMQMCDATPPNETYSEERRGELFR